MDYQEEHKKALTVATTVAETIAQLRVLQEEYPHLVAVVFKILYGQVVGADIECPKCGAQLSFTSGYPVGGLIDCCDDLEEAYELLGMEVSLCRDSDP